MARLSRRAFIERTGMGFAAATTLPSIDIQKNAAASETETHTSHILISLTVNGTVRTVKSEAHWTLAEVLRDHLDLKGTKIGCDRGQCGACTVLQDDKPIYSCSTLAIWSNERKITTVEGLTKNGKLDPLQNAFIENDGPQCGFCTSGQLMAAKALLAKNPNPTGEEVKQAMVGNICRCSNYNHYVTAVLDAACKDVNRA